MAFWPGLEYKWALVAPKLFTQDCGGCTISHCTISHCTMNIPFQAMQSISMLSRGLFHQDGDTGHGGEMILNSKRHLKEYDGVVIQGFDGEIIV